MLGSVLTTEYAASLPDSVSGAARHSVGDALALARFTGDPNLAHVAKDAFLDAMSTTCLVGTMAGFAAAVVAFCVLKPRPKSTATTSETPEPVAVGSR